MPIYYTVYKTTNLVNDEFYIGYHKTTFPLDDYLGSGKLLKEAIIKYGRNAFSKSVLYIAYDSDKAFEFEKRCIQDMNPHYNLHEGGNGGWDYINKNNLRVSFADWSEESQESYREKHRRLNARPFCKAHFKQVGVLGRAKVAELYPEGVWKGRTHKEESKQKIGSKNAIHQKGKGNSQYGTMWVTDGVTSMKIKKGSNIPEGFRKGRVMK